MCLVLGLFSLLPSKDEPELQSNSENKGGWIQLRTEIHNDRWHSNHSSDQKLSENSYEALKPSTQKLPGPPSFVNQGPFPCMLPRLGSPFSSLPCMSLMKTALG